MFKPPKKCPKMANFENLNLAKGSKTYSRWNLKKNNALDMDNLKKFEDRQLSTIAFFVTFSIKLIFVLINFKILYFWGVLVPQGAKKIV